MNLLPFFIAWMAFGFVLFAADQDWPGQEDTQTPSREYVEAARAVQHWIATQADPQGRLL